MLCSVRDLACKQLKRTARSEIECIIFWYSMEKNETNMFLANT